MPKSNKIIIFGAMKGRWYGDNSKHLFEWVVKNKLDRRPIWITSNNSIHEQLSFEKKPVSRSRSFYAAYLLSRALVAVFTNSLRDFSCDENIVPDSIKLIALRHGRSVKRVRFARKSHKITKEEEVQRHREGRLIRYVISTSEFVSEIQEKCLKVGREKHVVTGYPRNDLLLTIPNEYRDAWQHFLGDIEIKRVVLYGPTWRHGRAATKFFPFQDYDTNTLIEYLESSKTLLLLRPHVNDLRYDKLRDQLGTLTKASNLVKFATHEQFHDVNSLIPFVDVLVCDYSALYHDFLLLDRPIMFVPYDYEEMEEKNGFLYDYYANIPGPAVESLSDFIGYLKDVRSGCDTYYTPRRQLRDKIHAYKDNKSCERVYELIETILERE